MPKPRATKEELQLKRIEKLLEREKAWVAKQRRADTALKKIRKSLKHYEREGRSIVVLLRNREPLISKLIRRSP
jgi:hypothetical protein